MKYICNRYSVILAIITIVAALSFSEYRSYQNTNTSRELFSNVCTDRNIFCVIDAEYTWFSHLLDRFGSTDYFSYKSVDTIAFILEGETDNEGITEVTNVAIRLWHIRKIHFVFQRPDQSVLEELKDRFPSVTLIGPDDKPIL